jgi:hypothetical protein
LVLLLLLQHPGQARCWGEAVYLSNRVAVGVTWASGVGGGTVCTGLELDWFQQFKQFKQEE